MRSDAYGGAFCRAYDRLNRDTDYRAYADFALACQQRFGRDVLTHVCDMACGTGNLSLEFAKRGFGVTAFDLSEDMLAIADEKRFQSPFSARVTLTQQDLRSFRLANSAQLVCCMADSINYLTTPQEVKDAFHSVGRALSEGGVFVFDVNSRFQFEHVYADHVYALESETDYLVWQNDYNSNTRICTFAIDLFTRSGQGPQYRRYAELQRERMYTVRQLTTYLRETGFLLMGCYRNFSFVPANEATDSRLYLVAVKESGATTAKE